MSAGYSGTPLVKKLGIKPGFSIRVVHEPAIYWDWISPLPEDIIVITRAKKEGQTLFIYLLKRRKGLGGSS